MNVAQGGKPSNSCASLKSSVYFIILEQGFVQRSAGYYIICTYFASTDANGMVGPNECHPGRLQKVLTLIIICITFD